MTEVSIAFNEIMREMNPYEQTDSEMYNGWKMLMGSWTTAVQIGLKFEPLIICGDNYGLMSKFYTIMAHSLGMSRKITLVSSTSKLLSTGWFKTFHNYNEEITESQANLMVLIDMFEPGRTYEEIIERYRDRKTNILIIGNDETWDLNRTNRNLTIAWAKPLPDEVDTSDLNKYIKESLDSLNRMQDKFHAETDKHMMEYKRPHPLIIHDSNRSVIRQWFLVHYKALKIAPRIKIFHYDMPKMKRYDVPKRVFDIWMRDINTMKNEVSKHNILVFNFNDIGVEKMEKIDSKLAHVDPSGDCLLVYIVPDGVHGIMAADWDELHMPYTF